MTWEDKATVAARELVAALHAELVRYGLVAWTAGNVSGRVAGAKLFVIKPSGVSYDDPAPANMILCDLDGNVVPGSEGSGLSPASDTAAHAYVYRNMPQVGGVVHTHSTYATARAARGEPVPCVITGMADEFGGEIPVGPQIGQTVPIASETIDALFNRHQNVYGQQPQGALS